jgi:Ammonium Transporter Family
VAGLVAITPASGYVRPWAALLIGFAAGAVCELAVGLKHRLRYDDALDVVAVHGVGGMLGALLTGVFATTAVNPAGAQGLLYGNPSQVGRQAAAVGVTLLWSFLVSLGILKLLQRVMALRVSEEDEVAGLDFSQHAEAGYTLAEYGAAATPSPAPPATPAPIPAPIPPPAPAATSGPATQPPTGPRISFSKNLGAATPASPAYQARVRTGELNARLDVWREPRPDDPRMREAYWAEVLGVRLERANLPALETALQRFLVELLPSGKVPRYLLRVPGGRLVPVFEERGVLQASVEGHRSEGVDLSELRRAVSASMAEPGAPHGTTELEVLLFDQDLRGVAPVAILRHGDLWLPVFAEPPGVLCTGVAGRRLEATVDLEGMLALRDQVAERLLDAGKLDDPHDLAITTLAPETWTSWAAGLERVGELSASVAAASPALHRTGQHYLVAVQEPAGTLAVWCGRSWLDLSLRVQRRVGSHSILT